MILANAALFAGFAAQVGWSWPLPAYLVLAAGLVALTVIDLRDQLLPRRLILAVGAGTGALLTVAAAQTGAGDALLHAVLSAAGAYLVFLALRLVDPRALGGGDVNLAGLLGLALGWYHGTDGAARPGRRDRPHGDLHARGAGRPAGPGRHGTVLRAVPHRRRHLILLVAPDGRLFG